jgi:hypothetical protein
MFATKTDRIVRIIIATAYQVVFAKTHTNCGKCCVDSGEIRTDWLNKHLESTGNNPFFHRLRTGEHNF